MFYMTIIFGCLGCLYFVLMHVEIQFINNSSITITSPIMLFHLFIFISMFVITDKFAVICVAKHFMQPETFFFSIRRYM